MRRATIRHNKLFVRNLHFYPRSPCGERPPAGKVRPWASHISIHALLAESDRAGPSRCMGSCTFLSTLSLRRATLCPICQWRRSLNFYPRSPCGERRPPRHWHGGVTGHFYPRSPCGERPILGNPCAGCPAISIHALLAESDRRYRRRCRNTGQPFLSTLSLRRATRGRERPSKARYNFYPRSPCGERPGRVLQDITPAGIFLSTLSLRRATSIKSRIWPRSKLISIHALLAESDPGLPLAQPAQ